LTPSFNEIIFTRLPNPARRDRLPEICKKRLDPLVLKSLIKLEPRANFHQPQEMKMTDKPGSQEIDKAQVIVLSGYLGAGKTTLLKRILSWETDLSKTVVLVNEFGDVGIDGALLKNSGSDVIELTSGCICCTLSVDLQQSLTKIWSQFGPRRIFIEASGVADPITTAAVINRPDLAQYMTLSKIITVVDADFWMAREAFGTLFYNQLEMAHLILLNKIDSLDAGQASQFLTEIHDTVPDCQVVPTIHCAIDPQTLWAEVNPKTAKLKPIQFYQPDAESRDLRSETAGVRQAVDASNYESFAFESVQVVDEDCFYQFIQELPWEVFRVKGPVRFPDRVELLNFVGGKSEWLPWEGESQTKLVFIGWDVNPDDVLQKAAHCLC
jgi:G3E family GTPase